MNRLAGTPSTRVVRHQPGRRAGSSGPGPVTCDGPRVTCAPSRRRGVDGDQRAWKSAAGSGLLRPSEIASVPEWSGGGILSQAVPTDRSGTIGGLPVRQ
jgi:hypothetical protein